jgi:DNA-binding CsgD family transcriptional regulator
VDPHTHRQLSNLSPTLEAIDNQAIDDQAIVTPTDASPEKAHWSGRIPRSKPRTTRPLKPAQVDALVRGYEAGQTMSELAAEFGINRLTVSRHLRRVGVILRRTGLGPLGANEVANLYEAGWSSARLAERFDVSADTVLKALRHAGVAIRPRRGGPMPKAPMARLSQARD